MWKNEFFDLYFRNEINLDDFDKSLSIKNNHLPKSLYKYKEIDSHTIELLKTDLIYLSSVDELNDPYEGDIIYDLNELYYNFFTDEILKNINKFNIPRPQKSEILNSKNFKDNFLKYIYENDSFINKNKSFEEFKISLDNIFKKHYNEMILELNEKLKRDNLIVCFSETNLINPMWTHYASNHKGLCIEYNLKDSDNIFIKNSCFPIKYISNTTNQTDDLKNIKKINKLSLVTKPFLNKSTDWRYEKEWRLIFNNQPYLRGFIKKIKCNYFVKLPKPTAVYLGLNIIGKNKEKILKICKYREIPVFQMEKDSSNYNLHAKKILEFPKSNINQVDYIKECILNKNYKTLLRNFFFKGDTLYNIENSLDLIISSFKDINNENIIYFLDELLYKNNIFPTIETYYGLVLLFLIKLLNDEKYKNLKTSDGKNIEENINDWVSMSFFKFYNKKIVRYLILFERLLLRFYNIYVILNEYNRNEVKSKLPNFYKINVSYVEIIEYIKNNTKDKDESIIYVHPFSDPDLKEIVNEDILKNLDIILNKFYKNNKFDEENCFNELKKLERIVNKLEVLYEKQYNFIMEYSKGYFSPTYIPPNSYFDKVINGVCAILNKKDVLYLLNDNNKKFLQFIAKSRYYDSHIKMKSKIANFAEECCKKLGLKYEVKSLSFKELDEFFNPKTNILKLINKYD